MRPPFHKVAKIVSATLLVIAFLPAQAATLTVNVTSNSGVAVEDAVVYLMSNQTMQSPLRAPNARIDQINKTFVPLVSVVQTGTRISFPNKDNIRHHVYSFSKAKKFEIKLYADTPSKPVLFDQSGYVAMGCNIHDNMIAHMLVVDTPYFSTSDKRGVAQIMDVPPGEYSLVAWYYMRPDLDAALTQIKLKTDQTQALVIKTRSTD